MKAQNSGMNSFNEFTHTNEKAMLFQYFTELSEFTANDFSKKMVDRNIEILVQQIDKLIQEDPDYVTKFNIIFNYMLSEFTVKDKDTELNQDNFFVHTVLANKAGDDSILTAFLLKLCDTYDLPAYPIYVGDHMFVGLRNLTYAKNSKHRTTKKDYFYSMWLKKPVDLEFLTRYKRSTSNSITDVNIEILAKLTIDIMAKFCLTLYRDIFFLEDDTFSALLSSSWYVDKLHQNGYGDDIEEMQIRGFIYLRGQYINAAISNFENLYKKALARKDVIGQQFLKNQLNSLKKLIITDKYS